MPVRRSPNVKYERLTDEQPKDETSKAQSKGKFKGTSVKKRDSVKPTRIFPFNPEKNKNISERSVKSTGNDLHINGTLGSEFQDPGYPLTHQPELGKTEEEEFEIFKQLLIPYQHLPKEERQKAVLILIQDRLRENMSYLPGKMDKGPSSPTDILKKCHEGIDYKDYTVMCQRWCSYATEAGFLPEKSNARVLTMGSGNGEDDHKVFVYESDDSPPEKYVIDLLITKDKRPDIPADRGELMPLYDYFETFDISVGADYSYDPQGSETWTTSDKKSYDLASSTIDEDSYIDASLQRKDIVKIQEQWLAQGHSLTPPKKAENKGLKQQIKLIEAQQLLGKKDSKGRIISAATLKLTKKQKEALVGRFSKHHGRPITQKDLSPVKKTETRKKPEGKSLVSPKIKKRLKKANGPAAVAGLLGFNIAGAAFASRPDYLSTLQPPLGRTEAEEYAIFKSLLDPYRDLPEDQREKAVLVLMQDRLRQHISYAFDKDTEGTEQYTSSPAEILSDRGQGIDCEDYAVMCQRWTGYAKAEGLIPEDAKTHVVYVNTPAGDSGHAIFVYESNDIPPERYVIDTFSTGDENWSTRFEELLDRDVDSNGDGVVSFQEYFDNTDFEIKSETDFSYDPDSPGAWSYSNGVLTEDWIANGANSNTIGDSISREDIIARQKEWLDQGNGLGVPDDFQDDISDYEYQAELVEARQLLGKSGSSGEITADSLGLTREQRADLVGKYSDHYGRPFTEEDVDLHDPDIPDNDPAIDSLLDHPLDDSIHTEAFNDFGIDLEQFTDPLKGATEVGAGVLEGVLITAFAQKKLYTINKRRKAVQNAHKIRTAREQEIFKQLAKPVSGSYQLPNDKQKLEQIITLQGLLLQNNQSLGKEKFQELIVNLHRVVKASEPDSSITSDQYRKTAQKMGVNLKSGKVNMDLDKLLNYLKTHGQSFPNLFDIEEVRNPISKNQFQQFADLCFLEEEQSDGRLKGKDAPLKNVLKHNDSYIERTALSTLLKDILQLFEDSQSPISTEDRGKLKEFAKELEDDQSNSIQDKKKLESINKILKKVNIKIDYKTDKLFGSVRNSSKAIFHRIKINTGEMYNHLQKMDKLPRVKGVDDILTEQNKNIEALYHLRDYDQWKVRQHKRDRNIKLASAVTGFLPVSLGVDEILKAVAYNKDRRYRKKNEASMNSRITDAHKAIKTNKKTSLSKEEIKELSRLLSNARNVKQAHMSIKQNRSEANEVIHTVAAIADPFSTVMGPIGRGVKGGVKAAAKTTAAVAAMAHRKIKDKKLKKQNRFNETNDIYRFYKKLYLKAIEQGNNEKMDEIKDLAWFTYGVNGDSFDSLTRTNLVENNKFKLSFSQREVKKKK